ncbi:zinc/manganese transport system substrate-binding protein [Salinibacterium sp. CAN_S4]|uniref:metal ABC transporter substrate-binding protein n=1 Tax=Salinibacterium sp. CAN_S4 TaxID=2787727 RepID=UPI0018EF5DF2
MKTRSYAAIAATAALGLALAGCAGQPTAGDSEDSTVSVVASTNVYGDIAASVGGDLIEVTSIIDDPGKDPHEYEADAQDQLAFSKADLIIENGGGYDDFVETILASADNADVTVLTVADISGYDQEPAEGEFNEHMWYDFPSVGKLVDDIVAELSDIDPDNASTYSANGDSLKRELAGLEAQEDELNASFAGEGVAITEPVPLYMLEAVGLENLTPDAFAEAIEEDTDVPAAALQETLDLFSSKSVKLLAYNEQTTGPQTEAVLAAAEENGVAVVPVRETLPEGKTYIQWMQDDLDAISAALGG